MARSITCSTPKRPPRYWDPLIIRRPPLIIRFTFGFYLLHLNFYPLPLPFTLYPAPFTFYLYLLPCPLYLYLLPCTFTFYLLPSPFTFRFYLLPLACIPFPFYLCLYIIPLPLLLPCDTPPPPGPQIISPLIISLPL